MLGYPVSTKRDPSTSDVTILNPAEVFENGIYHISQNSQSVVSNGILLVFNSPLVNGIAKNRFILQIAYRYQNKELYYRGIWDRHDSTNLDEFILLSKKE